MPTGRVSTSDAETANLYCAECESQIGIFQNEWLHLTSLYAYLKETEVCFGAQVSQDVQTVPQGPSQKEAGGCSMARLVCKSCSHTVGQHCKLAPLENQQHLLNRNFYKLSRIFIRHAQTAAKIEPCFMDQGLVDADRLANAQMGRGRKDKMLSRSTTEDMSVPIQSTPSTSRGLRKFVVQRKTPQQSSPDYLHALPTVSSSSHSSQKSQRLGHQQLTCKGQETLQSPLQDSGASALLSGETQEHATILVRNFQRISAVETRVDKSEEMLHRLEANLDTCHERVDGIRVNFKAQEDAITRYEEIIKQQQVLLNRQQEELMSINKKLVILQESTEEIKRLQPETMQPNIPNIMNSPKSYDFLDNLEIMVTAMKAARNSDAETRKLREENESLKARLNSIATLMGSPPVEALNVTEQGCSGGQNDPDVLGKRKRDAETDSLPRKASRSIADRRVTSMDQEVPFPTPEPSKHDQQDHQRLSGELEAMLPDEEMQIASSAATTSTPSHIKAPSKQTKHDANSVLVHEITTPSLGDIAASHPNLSQPVDVVTDREIEVTNFPDHKLDAVLAHPAVTYHPHTILAGQTFIPPYAHGLINRMPSFHFANIAGTPTSYFESIITPGSHLSKNNRRRIQSPTEVSSDNHARVAGPFSNALDRGQKLEEVLLRASDSRRNSVNPSPMLPTHVNAVPVAEALELSDDESDASDESQPRSIPISKSIDPTGKTEVSLPALTRVGDKLSGVLLPPLERPVLPNDPPIKTKSTSRSNLTTAAPTVMPEFRAAIRNLDQLEVCRSSTPDAGILEHDASCPFLSSQGVAKKSRKSEPTIQIGGSSPRRSFSGIPPGFKSARASATKPSSEVQKENVEPSDMLGIEVENDDNCSTCGKGGKLLCCDGCPKSYHYRCLKPPLKSTDQIEGEWFCPHCIQAR